MGEDEARRQAEVRKKVEYQVACEERAHRIVERLIDNPITEETLLSSLHYITGSHYDDIVVERAVSKLCGYPLCENILEKVLKQKYTISMKTNKVYDIEARKNFCSNKCYKASKHLEPQIANDPVWSRKSLQPRKYELLPLDMKCGRVGDEIIVSKSGDLKQDLENLEKLDRYGEALQDHLNSGSDTGDQHTRVGNDTHDKLPDQRRTEHGVKTEPKDIEKKSEKNIEINEDDNGGADLDTLDKAVAELNLGKTFDTHSEISVSGKDSGDCDSDLNKEIKGEDQCFTNEITVKERLPYSHINTDKDVTAAARQKLVTQEVKDSKRKEDRNKEPSDKQKTKSATKAKTDYLMQLLDRKKALLAKMADIQTTQPPSNDTSQQVGREVTGESLNCDKNIDDETAEVVSGDMTRNLKSDSPQISMIREIQTSSCDKITVADCSHSELSEKTVLDSEEKIVPKRGKKSQSVGSKAKGDFDRKDLPKVTTLHVICNGIKSWITQETKEFLSRKTDVANTNTVDVSPQIKSPFTKQYDALVAKVDAQEKDFDKLLGEESLETDDSLQGSAPLPHFEVLKEELQNDQMRVSEFMKGSFTYKIQERPLPNQETGKPSVVLPTVDRYDQILIRQKIVLERISKVLPSILSPLQLLVQDVFTEMRQLVFTFNLSSENIGFKPAEWTIVTLVLLKMLSRQIPILERSFNSPGAHHYFTVLLTGIGSDLDTLQAHADLLFH